MAVDRDKILRTAQKHVDKQRFDKAIVEYQKLVADDPTDVRTMLKVGDLYLKLDNYEDAIKTYESVGDYYYREDFSVKAIAVYKQIRGIIRRHAQHLEGRYGHIVPRLAEIYTKLGLTSDALAAYDEVASRLRQAGRERDALDIFKKVVDLDPQNPIAHLRVADSQARLGDLDAAVDGFGDAAEIMVKLERIDDALKVLERLLEYRQTPKYARRAGELYLNRGGPNDGMTALTKLQICFKADPRDLDTLRLLARAFDAIDQAKKALEVLKEAARIAKEKNPEAYEELVGVLVSRSPADKVVKQFKADLEKSKNQGAAVEIEAVEVESVELDEADLIEAVEIEEVVEEVLELNDSDLQTVGDDELFGGGMPTETSAVRKLVAQAEHYRVQGYVPHAVQLLRDGLRNLGSSFQLRQKLSDLLLESGDMGGAIAEKLVISQELAGQGNIEGAVQILDEVLLLYPGHPDAAQMRAHLGYPVANHAGPAYAVVPPQGDAPLQSYDVESGGFDEALYRAAHGSGSFQAVDAYAQSGANAAYGQGHYQGHEQQGYNQAAAAAHLDEAALEQAESYAEQGYHDHARAILHQQLAVMPNHPLILERLAYVDQLAGQSQRGSMNPPESQPEGYPAASVSQQGPAVDAYAGFDGGYGQHQQPDSDSYHGQHPSHSGPQPMPTADDFASELDGVLDQVRETLKAQVDDADAATHYDLGVAYSEMGLHDDAIAELTLAARDPYRECVCISLIAQMQLQQGKIDDALDAFHRALSAQHKQPAQELAIGYEIGSIYEQKGMLQQALNYFEWLAKIDATYTDPMRGSVSDRIQALTTALSSAS